MRSPVGSGHRSTNPRAPAPLVLFAQNFCTSAPICIKMGQCARLLCSQASPRSWPRPPARTPIGVLTRLAELKNSGITYGSGPDAVGIGRRACQLMDEGHSEPDVIKGMTQQNAGFSNDAATKFTQIAGSVFCPQHTGGAVTPPQPTTQSNPPPFFPWPPIPAAL
jgi:hypothetical protein